VGDSPTPHVLIMCDRMLKLGQRLGHGFLLAPTPAPEAHPPQTRARVLRYGVGHHFQGSRGNQGCIIMPRSRFHMSWSRGPIARKKRSLIQTGLGVRRGHVTHIGAWWDLGSLDTPPHELFTPYCTIVGMGLRAPTHVILLLWS
jgi:hypothetical protein